MRYITSRNQSFIKDIFVEGTKLFNFRNNQGLVPVVKYHCSLHSRPVGPKFILRGLKRRANEASNSGDPEAPPGNIFQDDAL